jgi:hypothetical protein
MLRRHHAYNPRRTLRFEQQRQFARLRPLLRLIAPFPDLLAKG